MIMKRVGVREANSFLRWSGAFLPGRTRCTETFIIYSNEYIYKWLQQAIAFGEFRHCGYFVRTYVRCVLRRSGVPWTRKTSWTIWSGRDCPITSMKTGDRRWIEAALSRRLSLCRITWYCPAGGKKDLLRYVSFPYIEVSCGNVPA
jgi:hypothetical protein